jgi:hypothetical protein
LIALPVGTPSLRLLADKAAEVLAGMAHALDGFALLLMTRLACPAQRGVRLRVPDWLPALVDAGRTVAPSRWPSDPMHWRWCARHSRHSRRITATVWRKP